MIVPGESPEPNESTEPASPAATSDHDLAHRLATECGRFLLELRAAAVGGTGGDLTDLGDRGDAGANRLLLDALAAARPHDAVLSEESADGTARYDADRVWVVDPVDGTREFADPPRDDWAVHVALVTAGQPVAAAVALPASELTLSTAIDPLELAPAHTGAPRMVVSRSRAPQLAYDVAERLGFEVVPWGSAGAKAMAVVRGLAEVYLHAGGQYEWDSCAPVGVALHAGLHCSRLDGSALVYNQPTPRPQVPELLICRTELRDAILSTIAELRCG